MKIIFLDIDGVLNHRRTAVHRADGYIGICQIRTGMLKEIVEKTGAKIVLSSTWRLTALDRGLVKEALAPYGMKFIDCTPDFSNRDYGYRWQEIKYWLDNHPDVERFVILDDDPEASCPDFAKFWVKTSFNIDGLTPMHVRQAIHLLNA